jgi:hypothetical protein
MYRFDQQLRYHLLILLYVDYVLKKYELFVLAVKKMLMEIYKQVQVVDQFDDELTNRVMIVDYHYIFH